MREFAVVLALLLALSASPAAAAPTARFAEVFGREPVETDPAELGVAPAGGGPAPATLGDPR